MSYLLLLLWHTIIKSISLACFVFQPLAQSQVHNTVWPIWLFIRRVIIKHKFNNPDFRVVKIKMNKKRIIDMPEEIPSTITNYVLFVMSFSFLSFFFNLLNMFVLHFVLEISLIFSILEDFRGILVTDFSLFTL